MKKISSILFLSLILISLYPRVVKPEEIFETKEKESSESEQLFEQEVSEDDDFEIPLFLDKDKKEIA
mgnify:CR=1 FL=1